MTIFEMIKLQVFQYSYKFLPSPPPAQLWGKIKGFGNGEGNQWVEKKNEIDKNEHFWQYYNTISY